MLPGVTQVYEGNVLSRLCFADHTGNACWNTLQNLSGMQVEK